MKEILEDTEKLLSLSDDDIRALSEDWSFNGNEFFKEIKNSERWQQVIRTHIYLEHVIDLLLKDEIRYPDEINFAGMSFRHRVDLTRALDLLPAELVNAVRFISKLRNNLAHNLSFSIEDSQIVDLRNCTPKDIRESADETLAPNQENMELPRLLTAVLVFIEVLRHQHNARRLFKARAQANVSRSLAAFHKALEVPIK